MYHQQPALEAFVPEPGGPAFRAGPGLGLVVIFAGFIPAIQLYILPGRRPAWQDSHMPLIWKFKPDSAVIRDKVMDGDCLLIRDPERLPSNAAMRHESMLINEITLVLAEKRTSLSVMRTGIAILALPVSVLSVLVVISRYYDPAKVMYLLGPLLGLCGILTVLGAYMIYTSFKRVGQLNRVITALKKQNESLRELCVAMDDLVAPDPDF